MAGLMLGEVNFRAPSDKAAARLDDVEGALEEVRVGCP